MTTYDWLLFFHILGAAAFLGGAVAAGVLQIAAMRHERPADIAWLLRLTRIPVAIVGAGGLVTLALGLALADHVGYGFGESWIVASIVLWVVSGALGGAGGRTARHARELAERLASEGDRPSEELRSLVSHRPSLLLSYVGAVALVAILVLMVWRPGS
jgi:uncharacterized membrane protein